MAYFRDSETGHYLPTDETDLEQAQPQPQAKPMNNQQWLTMVQNAPLASTPQATRRRGRSID